MEAGAAGFNSLLQGPALQQRHRDQQASRACEGMQRMQPGSEALGDAWQRSGAKLSWAQRAQRTQHTQDRYWKKIMVAMMLRCIAGGCGQALEKKGGKGSCEAGMVTQVQQGMLGACCARSACPSPVVAVAVADVHLILQGSSACG